MSIKILSFIFGTLMPISAFAALPYVGLYQTIDDETNTPKSIVQLYEYQDGDNTELAGRIVALYDANGVISETLENPTRVAEKVKNTPKMVGLDIIWDMAWDADDKEFSKGKIMDPKSGKIYSSVIWQDATDSLNVRGKIGPFGRTQKWNVMQSADLPAALQNIDTGDWAPTVRK